MWPTIPGPNTAVIPARYDRCCKLVELYRIDLKIKNTVIISEIFKFQQKHLGQYLRTESVNVNAETKIEDTSCISPGHILNQVTSQECGCNFILDLLMPLTKYCPTYFQDSDKLLIILTNFMSSWQ